MDSSASDKHVTHDESVNNGLASLNLGKTLSTCTSGIPDLLDNQQTSKSNKVTLEEFMYFIKSGLHPDETNGNWVRWPNSTIIVCSIQYKDRPSEVAKFENTKCGEHAEAKLESYLEQKGKSKIKSVTLYSNYSPCNMEGHECSTKLIKLNNEIKICVRFAALYYIRRPSCKDKSCHCYSTTTQEESQLAFQKLLELDAEPFQDEDWKDLISFPSEDPKELKDIRYGEKYKEWRNKEDLTMKEDFKKLKQLSQLSSPLKTPASSSNQPPRPSKHGQHEGRGNSGEVNRELDFSK